MAHSRTPSAVAGEPGSAMARARATAWAEVVASVPTQTIRRTPASAARASTPASSVAWVSPAAPSAASGPSPGWPPR